MVDSTDIRIHRIFFFSLGLTQENIGHATAGQGIPIVHSMHAVVRVTIFPYLPADQN
jgi:hypothetical protein